MAFTGRPSRRALILLAAGGGLCIWAAFWIGPLAFYYTFQKRFDDESLYVRGGIVGAYPAPAAAAAESTCDWVVKDGTSIPVPAGARCEIHRKDDVFVAVLPEGSIAYRRMPADFVRSLYLEELRETGAAPRGSVDERGILKDIIRTTPAQFRMRWPLAERSAYAARLLAKLRLWEDRPVGRVSEHEAPDGAAVLVVYADGSAKAIVLRNDAALVISLPPESPAEWKISARQWLGG